MNTPDSPTSTPTPGEAPAQASSRSPLFVSYSRSDRIAVDKLAADLRQRGYLLWMDVDERGIIPGEDWQRKLVTAMSGAQGVLACVSPDFLTSPYCRAEIEQAQREGKPIYPVLVRRLGKEQSLADFKLDHLQFTDLTADYEEGLRRLLVALPRPQQPLRSALRLGFILLASLLVLVVIFAGAVAATRQGVISVQASITPIPPTPTIDLRSYDVGVLLSYFTIDPAHPLPDGVADATIERFAVALDQQLGAELGKSGLGLTYKLEGPIGVRRITGASPDIRRQAAASLLQDRAAKVIIYGEISYDDTLKQPRLSPEFYIDVGQYFNDASDLTGSYAFGKQIPADSLEDRSKLGARVTALSYVMTGVFQHMTRNYNGALTSYQAALSTPNWTEDDGKEVINVLIGSAQLKLAETAARRCERDAVLTHTADAEAAFLASQQIADKVRPEFSRAYAGLANVYALRALWIPEKNDGCAARQLNVAALQQAVAYIDQFRARFDLSREEPSVASKLLLTELQVRFLVWAAQSSAVRAEPDNVLYQDFLTVVAQIIKDYSGRSGLFDSPVMEAHLFRGQSLYARRLYRDALADYDAAMRVYNDSSARSPYPLIAPERAMTVYSLRGDAYKALRDYSAAAAQYGEALKLAIALDNKAAAAAYDARQKEMDMFVLTSPTPVPPAATATLEASSTTPPTVRPTLTLRLTSTPAESRVPVLTRTRTTAPVTAAPTVTPTSKFF